MHDDLTALLADTVKKLGITGAGEAGVIPWSSPVLVFGDPAQSRVATLGINPSSREFVDESGRELDGALRRFHTLASLGLRQWADAKPQHLRSIAQYCVEYFHRRPYDTWFKKLDAIIAGAGATYYGMASSACHLDLVPFATASRWTTLKPAQRTFLLNLSGETFAVLLRDSPIEVLVLNGRTVVGEFERLAPGQMDTRAMPAWTLPRTAVPGVGGSARWGVIETIGSIRLGRGVLVLGFNHNIQSSFGVTRGVVAGIKEWVADVTNKRRLVGTLSMKAAKIHGETV